MKNTKKIPFYIIKRKIRKMTLQDFLKKGKPKTTKKEKKGAKKHTKK